MNIVHLKYAVEIARTKSISKAAENLYMAQPNLSRAVKELEEALGITIFKRTSKGITVTPEGEEFLRYAKRIISQVEEVEAIYQNGKSRSSAFLSVCRERAILPKRSPSFQRISARSSLLTFSIKKQTPCVRSTTLSRRTIISELSDISRRLKNISFRCSGRRSSPMKL